MPEKNLEQSCPDTQSATDRPQGVFRLDAGQVPDVWSEAEKVDAIPAKRAPPVRASYLERDEVEAMFAGLPTSGAPLKAEYLISVRLMMNPPSSFESIGLGVKFSVELPMMREMKLNEA